MGTHTVMENGAEASVFVIKSFSVKPEPKSREMEREDSERKRETCESHRDREIVFACSLGCAMLMVPVLSRRCCFGRVL